MTNLLRVFGWVLGTVVAGIVWSCLAAGPACAADRSDLTLAESLLGHWRAHSGKAEYYFAADGGLVMTEKEGRQEQTYKVVATDDDEEVLRIAVKVTATGGGHEKELRFASDRLSLMSTLRRVIDGRTYTVNVSWHYVDDARHPPK